MKGLYFLYFYLCCLLFACHMQASEYYLLPRPQKFTEERGHFVLDKTRLAKPFLLD